jgi:hypothetical protein
MADTPNPGFVSAFKNNEQLRRCAVSDKDHIGERVPPPFDQAGPHVSLIHKALNSWASRQPDEVLQGLNLPLDEADDILFDSDTTEAVVRFKTVNGLLNFAGKIDPIVGKLTVRALDRELAGAPVPKPTPGGGGGGGTANTVKFKDVIFAISAIGHRGEIQTRPQLEQFVRNRVVTAAYQAKTDRDLTVRAAFIQDSELNKDNPSFDSTLANLQALPKDGQQLGKVMLYGISRGGVLITKLAKKVSGPILSNYVGVSDGAFFERDTTNVPIDIQGRLNTPRMDPQFAAFRASRKVNIFQTKGNSLKVVNPLNNPKGALFAWFSQMFGGEIHGEIPGYENQNKDALITSRNAVELHGEAARLGEDIILLDMRAILIAA